MSLQNDATMSLGVVEHLEQEVLVAIGGVMLQSLQVQLMRFCADFRGFRWRQKPADQRKPVGVEFRDEIRHVCQRITPLYACQVAWPNSGAITRRPASSGA